MRRTFSFPPTYGGHCDLMTSYGERGNSCPGNALRNGRRNKSRGATRRQCWTRVTVFAFLWRPQNTVAVRRSSPEPIRFTALWQKLPKTPGGIWGEGHREHLHGWADELAFFLSNFVVNRISEDVFDTSCI